MASPIFHLLLLSLLSITLLKINADTTFDVSSNMTHLHFYMHDTVSGSNPTAIQVTKGPANSKGKDSGQFSFGSMFMIDDPLTEAPKLTSNVVGRAQGFYAYAGLSGTELLLSANIVLMGGDYNGSTITVFGRDNFADSVRELPVIGGSGKFRMAQGYMLIKTNTANVNTGDAVLDCDLYVTNSVASSGGSTSGGDSATSNTTGTTSGGSILFCPNYVAIFVMSCFLAKHLMFGF